MSTIECSFLEVRLDIIEIPFDALVGGSTYPTFTGGRTVLICTNKEAIANAIRRLGPEYSVDSAPDKIRLPFESGDHTLRCDRCSFRGPKSIELQ